MARVTGIDHVIIGTHDLPAAVALFGDVLGFHVSGGGNHPQFGTANRIIVLEQDYLELLAPQPGLIPSSTLKDVLESGEGAMACVPAVDDLVEFSKRLQLGGVKTTGPTHGRLDAEEGYSRGWDIVTPIDPLIPGIPFFIKHNADGDERLRLLGGPAGRGPHNNGARRIASVTIAVADSREAAEKFERVLGIASTTEGHDPLLTAYTLDFRLPSGAVVVLASPEEAQIGPVASFLKRKGESVFALCVAVGDLEEAVKTLRERGVGVRVDEVEGILTAAQLHTRNALGARIGLVAALTDGPA